MPPAAIPRSAWPELVRLAVREKQSHKAIAQVFGCHPSVVTRTLKRAPVVELADAEHRKEAAARRAQEYRDRKVAKADADALDGNLAAARITGNKQARSPVCATVPGQ